MNGGVRSRPVRLIAPAALLALALVVGACGGSDGGGETSGAGTGGSAEAVPDLSGVTMTDLTGGGEVALAAALDAPPSTPVLAFFWAPF